MARQIGIDELRPGMVIVQIAEQNGPVKIRKSGLVTSVAMVQGLREMGVLAVTIDPAQTVELEAQDNGQGVPHSPTKDLLMQGVTNKGVDNKLSEQFHRSLFLPSVQSLPGSWQYYGRRAVTASLVLAGGLAMGWTAATYQQWWTAFQAPELTSPLSSSPVQAPVSAGTQAHESKAAPIDVQSFDNAVDEEAQQTGRADTAATEPEPEPEGQIVQVNPDRPPVDISPELVEKFQQAVSELETEPQEPQPAAPQPVRDVVRVDQLPAWALAEIPSLSFSAHMYASEPADRWVRVNNMELGEGDWINDNLRIVRIESQHVILAFKGQEFSMRALTDW